MFVYAFKMSKIIENKETPRGDGNLVLRDKYAMNWIENKETPRGDGNRLSFLLVYNSPHRE